MQFKPSCCFVVEGHGLVSYLDPVDTPIDTSLLLQLYAWPGYDFWGVLLALVGFSASVLFSRSANSSAKAARLAAENAWQSFGVVDATGRLGVVQKSLTEIRLRAERGEWSQASESCESVRIAVATHLTSERLSLSEEAKKSLTGLQSQMATLQKTANEILHNQADYDLVKIKTILSKLSESVAKVLTELQEKLERN
ncbi:hypothetical protein [uncultured Tateyamaria sp.]|uniref:hypothetical protein n=1 Tax=uncultured Tateyamaria sp. TaxID=455651 RepID=UPI0026093A3F|nr:hypothetical protein [uncultured Tateyamaria sp.]